jgi:hypothetical protein
VSGRAWWPLLLLALAAVAADVPQKPATRIPAASAEDEKAQPQKDAHGEQQHEEQDHDNNESGAGPAGPLSLTLAQQEAVGIRTARPLPLTSAPRVDAYATVLDPATLVADLGRVDSTRAAANAAAAEAERAQRLYRDEAQTSLKSWQLAQAQAAEAAAQASAAAIGFGLQWGPLANLEPEQRRALVEELSKGHRWLLRADVPGLLVGAVIERNALLQIDDVSVAAQVLGPLPRTDAQLQSSAWLLQVSRAPAGLGPGVRALAQLHTVALRGLLVPASALVYAEDGTFVYRQEVTTGGEAFRYAAVPVRPLTRIGGAWLVEGVGRSDPIVVQGVGVLWSLQGIGSFSAAEEEHD